jgi:hypothetical protein
LPRSRHFHRPSVNPDAVHAHHYIPDVAAGLAVLGSAPADAYGRACMLPFAPAGTLRNLVARFSKALGREIGISVMPRWLLKDQRVGHAPLR